MVCCGRGHGLSGKSKTKPSDAAYIGRPGDKEGFPSAVDCKQDGGSGSNCNVGVQSHRSRPAIKAAVFLYEHVFQMECHAKIDTTSTTPSLLRKSGDEIR